MFTCAVDLKREDNINEMEYLLGVWKDIIIKQSNNRYSDLRPHLKEIIDKVVLKYNMKFIKTQSLSGQLDKQIIYVIIKLAVLTNSEDVIDMIYKRTRSSMIRYFYHERLTQAYLELKNTEKALSIPLYMLKKEHYAYWYAIYNYKPELYTFYPDFKKSLEDIRNIVIRKLLAIGEKVDIGEMTLTDIQNLLSDVEKYQ
jgi:hypothetical protein